VVIDTNTYNLILWSCNHTASGWANPTTVPLSDCTAFWTSPSRHFCAVRCWPFHGARSF